MKKSQTIIAMIIVAAAVAGGSFYGGLLFGQSKNFPNKDFGNMQVRTFGNGMPGGQAGNGNKGGGNFLNGEIISKDNTSITVKLADGGSKIAFFSTSTEVGKFVTSTPDSLTVGENVMVTGKSNSDGSVTAQSIQLRSNMPIMIQNNK